MRSSQVPRKPIDLVPLPISSRPSELAHSFAQHMHDLHAEIRKKKLLSNAFSKDAASAASRILRRGVIGSTVPPTNCLQLLL